MKTAMLLETLAWAQHFFLTQGIECLFVRQCQAAEYISELHHEINS